MLPIEAIIEYKKLYEKHFRVILSDSEASLRANNLVNLYKATLGSKDLNTTKVVAESRCNY